MLGALPVSDKSPLVVVFETDTPSMEVPFCPRLAPFTAMSVVPLPSWVALNTEVFAPAERPRRLVKLRVVKGIAVAVLLETTVPIVAFVV